MLNFRFAVFWAHSTVFFSPFSLPALPIASLQTPPPTPVTAEDPSPELPTIGYQHSRTENMKVFLTWILPFFPATDHSLRAADHFTEFSVQIGSQWESPSSCMAMFLVVANIRWLPELRCHSPHLRWKILVVLWLFPSHLDSAGAGALSIVDGSNGEVSCRGAVLKC